MLLVTKRIIQAQTVFSGLFTDSTIHLTSVFTGIGRSTKHGRGVTVCPSVRQTIISNYTPVRAHLQWCIAFVINWNTGYNFPHPMVVVRQHKSRRQDKRIIVVDNGKNLRDVKNVLISKGTARLVELHVVTNLKDGEVYP